MWILVWVSIGYNVQFSGSQEFSSYKSCEDAKVVFASEFKKKYPFASDYSPLIFCVKK